MQSATLYSLNLTTNQQTVISPAIGLTSSDTVNGIGYNVLDNYLYGADLSASGASTVIQIAANGSSKRIGTLSGTTSRWNVGDVDTQGRFWLSISGKQWAQVDVRPASTTYGQVVQSGTSAAPPNYTGTSFTALDWVYLPSQGQYLWSLLSQASSTNLMRWDLNAHTWTLLQNYGNLTGTNAFGALYASGAGELYGSENTSGDLWKFPIPSGTPSKVTSGSPVSLNDGARCVYAADPAAASSSS